MQRSRPSVFRNFCVALCWTQIVLSLSDPLDPKVFGVFGHYSPYIPGRSSIPFEKPKECNYTFVQGLYRHGARCPSTEQGKELEAVVNKIQKASGVSATSPLAKLLQWKYNLGEECLIEYGEQQLEEAGEEFFNRYKDFTIRGTPFMRSSGVPRVQDSAERFRNGYQKAKGIAYCLPEDDPLRKPDLFHHPQGLTIPNPLRFGLCDQFEQTRESNQKKYRTPFIAKFVPPITSRINSLLPGVTLTDDEILLLMEVCPFATVAVNPPKRPDWCDVFSADDWNVYGYYNTLGLYYGYGPGHPLGPTLGVGWVNEVIARIRREPVKDHTSVNQEIDADRSKFPLDRKVYIDVSHDVDIVPMMSVLGAFSELAPLPTDRIPAPEQAGFFWAAWLVPFAARETLEILECPNEASKLVRLISGERVLPMKSCGGNELGMCKLQDFMNSLGFAEKGGDWDKC